MSYHVRIIKPVFKQLTKKFDPFQANLIISWLKENMEGTNNPREHGKPLTSNLKGLWRYRIGKYRIISIINNNQLVVLVIDVAHRRDVYNGTELKRIQKRADRYLNNK